MKYLAKIGEDEREYSFAWRDGKLIASCGDRESVVDVARIGDGEAISLLVDGQSVDVVAEVEGEEVVVLLRGERYEARVENDRERAAHAVAGARQGGNRELRAAMPGVVVAVQVAVGDEVVEGQTLVVLEAMKMQNPLCAEAPGKVTRIVAETGAAVAAGALLVELE